MTKAIIPIAALVAAGLAFPATAQDGDTAAEAPARITGNADRNFADQASAVAFDTSIAAPLSYPNRTIVEGTIIQAVLEFAIDSSLPGTIRATVMNNVLGYDGSETVFPKGTRIIGTYNSDLSIAQERALVVWTRAITPQGQSLAIGSFGADRLGRAGVTGEVDTHFWERFGSAALISILGAAPAIAISESGASDGTEAVTTSIGDDLRTNTASILSEYLSIPPTIHVDQGDVVTIIAGRDLVVFN